MADRATVSLDGMISPSSCICAEYSFAQSLSGHTSAVECVAFDGSEEVVVAGSAGGTLKLWDLDEGKRTKVAISMLFELTWSCSRANSRWA